ncbi:hypothetical protein [Dehalogenimonas formicexedens]|uniref:hypothetical protein n=1 Tax=Dehalogenimonas formicexedens TaxID=1839801 RepID=UPI00096B6D55|nr:hypothetical protein [Dehalogenimonas formicexedens]
MNGTAAPFGRFGVLGGDLGVRIGNRNDLILKSIPTIAPKLKFRDSFRNKRFCGTPKNKYHAPPFANQNGLFPLFFMPIALLIVFDIGSIPERRDSFHSFLRDI